MFLEILVKLICIRGSWTVLFEVGLLHKTQHFHLISLRRHSISVTDCTQFRVRRLYGLLQRRSN